MPAMGGVEGWGRKWRGAGWGEPTHTFRSISLNMAAASLALFVLEQRCSSAAYVCASGDIPSFFRVWKRNVTLAWLP